MSRRELGRVELLAWVRSGELQVVDAAALMRVSYRQAKRLWKRYGEEGATGLKHRSAGRTSNRTHPGKFRRKVLGLVGKKYGGASGADGRPPSHYFAPAIVTDLDLLSPHPRLSPPERSAG